MKMLSIFVVVLYPKRFQMFSQSSLALFLSRARFIFLLFFNRWVGKGYLLSFSELMINKVNMIRMEWDNNGMIQSPKFSVYLCLVLFRMKKGLCSASQYYAETELLIKID